MQGNVRGSREGQRAFGESGAQAGRGGEADGGHPAGDQLYWGGGEELQTGGAAVQTAWKRCQQEGERFNNTIKKKKVFPARTSVAWSVLFLVSSPEFEFDVMQRLPCGFIAMCCVVNGKIVRGPVLIVIIVADALSAVQKVTNGILLSEYCV